MCTSYPRHFHPRFIIFPHTLSISEIGKPHRELEKDAGLNTIKELNRLRLSEGKYGTAEVRLNMQKVMQSDAAVFRTQESLDEGTDLWSVNVYGTHDRL